jgi:hypothetical protein
MSALGQWRTPEFRPQGPGAIKRPCVDDCSGLVDIRLVDVLKC